MSKARAVVAAVARQLAPQRFVIEVCDAEIRLYGTSAIDEVVLVDLDACDEGDVYDIEPHGPYSRVVIKHAEGFENSAMVADVFRVYHAGPTKAAP